MDGACSSVSISLGGGIYMGVINVLEQRQHVNIVQWNSLTYA